MLARSRSRSRGEVVARSGGRRDEASHLKWGAKPLAHGSLMTDEHVCVDADELCLFACSLNLKGKSKGEMQI